jgi:hypothetical protein
MSHGTEVALQCCVHLGLLGHESKTTQTGGQIEYLRGWWGVFKVLAVEATIKTCQEHSPGTDSTHDSHYTALYQRAATQTSHNFEFVRRHPSGGRTTAAADFGLHFFCHYEVPTPVMSKSTRELS